MASILEKLAETLPGIVDQHQHKNIYLLAGPADSMHQLLTNLNLGDIIMAPFGDNFVISCDQDLVVDDVNILEKLR